MRKRMISLVLLVIGLCLVAAAAQAATLDNYFTCKFSYSPAVYSGPGTSYYRANNSKAQYGGGGVARVYGQENGWILIGYQLGSGDYRIGYIEGKAVNKMHSYSGSGNIPHLSFEYRSVTLSSSCSLTDDPVINTKTVFSLAAGTSCTYLASLNGKWAYIEVYTSSGWTRGFVPLSSVSGYSGNSGGTYQSGNSGYSGYNGGTSYSSSGVWAVAKQKLATRSGPSTRYTDTGTYFLQDQAVLVLAKHWDSVNNIWWVKCRIETGNTDRYLWTGAKRFYNEDYLVSQLPIE